MKTKLSILILFLLTVFSYTTAQNPKAAIEKDKKASKDSTYQVAPNKREAASNMLLNASSDNGPRQIDIGLPLGTYGATITEDGLLVSYDANGVMPTKIWRNDGSFYKIAPMSFTETAIRYGDVSVSAASYSNTGTFKQQGKATFATNSYGLLRGNLMLSGPVANHWYYSVNGYISMDPGTNKSLLNRYRDQVERFKFNLKKKYNNNKDELGIRLKFANIESALDRQTPYTYNSDGTVSELNGLYIGRTAYTEPSKTVTIINPYTGQTQKIDKLKDAGSTTLGVELFGENQLSKLYKLTYIAGYNHSNSGFYNTLNNAISSTDNLASTARLVYAGNSNNQVYTGYYQNVMCIVSPKTPYNTIQTRTELERTGKNNHWTLGLNTQFYNAVNTIRSTFSYLQEVTDNPNILIQQKYVNNSWVNAKANDLGYWNMNGSWQYYSGYDMKNAIYFVDNWNITNKFSAVLSARLELQNINGVWCPDSLRSASSNSSWLSGQTQKIVKHFLNKNVSANLTYKVNHNFGLTGEASYFELGGNLSDYCGSDDPHEKQGQIPYLSAGIYYNSSFVSLVSRVNRIERTNINLNTNFTNDAGESLKKTINYGVKTVGWTTDAIVTPFKGMQLHLMLTLQNPKYENFEFSVYGQDYNYNDLPVRSESKTLIEIEPTYSWSKFSVWGSARYFSKESANYPASLYFASRWETFVGFKYMYNKNLNFSIDAVNLLNQTGAQGSLSGSNTMIDGSSYYGKVLAGTYIRPFTLEFKMNLKF